VKIPDRPVISAHGISAPLLQRLVEVFTGISTKLNQLARGSIEGADAVATAAPTTGLYAQGDQIRHSAPVEAGAVGQKYVVVGWVCVAGGSPGTWVQMRVLTGN
jgi:hypothetical protein